MKLLSLHGNKQGRSAVSLIAIEHLCNALKLLYYSEASLYEASHFLPFPPAFSGLLIPRFRTALTQHLDFAIVGLSLFNDLPPAIRSKSFFRVSLTSSRCLKSVLFPQAVTLKALLIS